MDQHLEFDPDLIGRYDTSGPRYTSYPTALEFTEDFGNADYRAAATASNASGAPLSLYFHLPFCDTVCFYCACNKVITKNRKRAIPYLDQLHREIALQGDLFDNTRPVEQLHWGGGTPTFISQAQMRELMDVTRRHFNLRDDDSGEYSIEVDPREAKGDTIDLLRELGFNRLSLGVQDFDPSVQKAVNRIQSEEETWAVMDNARRAGFKSVSVDLIYGLPLQTLDRFATTIDKVIAAGPDRLSVFNYAHLPQLFKTQRQIDESQLPSAEEKLAILGLTIDKLTAAGYLYIGMDHFARPDDELAIAQRNGLLYRNFQGYSTHADCDLVAMGATAISRVADTYSQNLRGLEDYAARIEADELAVFRGLKLSADDQLRRALIMALICQFELDIDAFASAQGVDFGEYFAAELNALQAMANDGLLEMDARRIRVLPRGRLLIRNICMVFDRYRQRHDTSRFSKVI